MAVAHLQSINIIGEIGECKMTKSNYLKEIQKRDELIRVLQTENHNLRQIYLDSVKQFHEAKRQYQAALDDLKA